MSFTKLPSEIIYLIIKFLNNDFRTVSSLYAVNRGSNESLRPLMYQSVVLGSAKSLGSFCDVMTSLQPGYSTYVTALKILPENWVDGVNYFQVSEEFAVQCRHALEALKNLKFLCLIVAPAVLEEILDHLTTPFNLNTFDHSGEFSQPLLRFLRMQPSLIKLGSYGPVNESEDFEWHCAIALETQILPNLAQVGGSLYFVALLMRLRPISSIRIQSPSRSRTMAAFGDLFTRSVVPITRIFIVEGDSEMGKWVTLMSRLRAQHAASSNLREITVAQLYKSGGNDVDRRNREKLFLDTCSFVFRFDALEKLEFTIVPTGQGTHYGPSPADACAWLATNGMQDLSAWRRNNPLLHTVVVYGYVVPETQPSTCVEDSRHVITP
ncbi:unnamed protein product [Rhizoctonia solani]|uniref:Uncharacterized protein n=1 Tax=Rhizoctonia solani TaxID=456999 RepID=A0A8H2WXT5_9AGAM|nr:unnamed protein product [Rhizoctonia solani]